MKSKIKLKWMLGILLFVFAACSGEEPKEEQKGGGEEPAPPFGEVLVGDFESEKTSPYFFRFGNKGSAKEGGDYVPRWNYTYELKANPVRDTDNESAYVLSYQSMEAQNYGIKVLLSNPMPVKGLRNVCFKIYQPQNVIGKPTWKEGATASRQRICVKLLSEFNTINDFKQDEGLVLEDAVCDFKEEGSWQDYRFAFNPEEISDWKLELFKKGIVGLAIMPTYGAGVTLSESSVYQCYIDDIKLNVRGE